MLNELARSIRFDNESKGFDPTEGGVNRYILLTISELCEAQNELRDGKGRLEIYYEYANGHKGINEAIKDGKMVTMDSPDKPCGYPVEIADAFIRLLDIGAKFDMDFDSEAVSPIDFGAEATDDDWLLGIIDMISDMFNSSPGEYDWNYSLRQSVNTIIYYCQMKGIDLGAVTLEKLAYNRSRPPKHGRQF